MNFLLIIILTAMILDWLFGDPHTSMHPVAVFGRFAMAVEKKWRRYGNGIRQGVAAWGCAVIPVTVITGMAVWSVMCWGGESAAAVVAGAVVYFAIALRSLNDHAMIIEKALRKHDMRAARKGLAMIVSRKCENIPENEIVRGAVESLGENLTDAVTSPLFWTAVGFMAAGIPGAAAFAVFFRAVNTLDACWGYKNERYILFGRFAAKMDDLCNFIPARMTLIIIAIAAITVGGNPVKTVITGFRHRHDHPSPNSCWSMAGFAGALNVRLGGDTMYPTGIEHYPVWGDGTAALNAELLRKARILTRVSGLIFAAVCIGVDIWMERFF